MARPFIARAGFALVMLLAVAALPARAADKVVDVFIAHAQPQDANADPAAIMVSEFRRRLGELSGGTLKAGIFPDGQLGGNRDMAQLVSKGVIQSALVTVGGIAPLYPLITVTGMPFALDSIEAAYALYDGPFGQSLAADMERRTGLVVLGFGDAGGLHILTNSRRPVRSPTDLAGLKIRTIPGYKSLDAMIRGLGAKPVNVSSREEFQSLEAGIIDGQMNPASVVVARRYDQVQAHATLTGHLYAPYVWIYNRDAFIRLSAAEQEAVREAARRAVAAGRALSAQLDQSERGAAGLGKRMRIHVPSAAERAAFKASCQPAVAEALGKTLGDEGVNLLADFMTAARQANEKGRRR
jgi:TRAP-type C4-dicarboxylate transport system substrate-binding protein